MDCSCIFSNRRYNQPWCHGQVLCGKYFITHCLGHGVHKQLLECEIVFERESMTSFGSKTPVHYDVKNNEVVVMDTSLQLGNTYKIVDKDTISSKMGNVTTTFKRVQ